MDSSIIEVILFAIPFMLVTNVLVLVAITRDNVWLLLPWMVLHCVVIAFLALGAAILSAHDKGALGFASLLSGIVFLLCWKALRQLFMKMVDRQMKERDMLELDAAKAGEGADLDEQESIAREHRNQQIFFGSKERKFYHGKNSSFRTSGPGWMGGVRK